MYLKQLTYFSLFTSKLKRTKLQGLSDIFSEIKNVTKLECRFRFFFKTMVEL